MYPVQSVTYVSVAQGGGGMFLEENARERSWQTDICGRAFPCFALKLASRCIHYLVKPDNHLEVSSSGLFVVPANNIISPVGGGL